MDAARRQRYLKLLGIDAWQLRGSESAELIATDPLPVTATAPRPAPALSESQRAVDMPRARSKPDVAPAIVAAATAPLHPRVLDVPADWDGLRAVVKDCQACKLCETRTHTVFGVGSQNSPLMIVGEGPGADEDAQGEPFVGRAGKLLDEMLKAIGRSRAEASAERAVFIANVVKCRPPGNRDPEADEVDACRRYLDRQIELVRPKLIVALGRIAAQRLLNSDEPLARLRGPQHLYGETRTPVLVTYHPAYLLRSPREKAKSWEDFKKIHRFMAGSA